MNERISKKLDKKSMNLLIDYKLFNKNDFSCNKYEILLEIKSISEDGEEYNSYSPYKYLCSCVMDNISEYSYISDWDYVDMLYYKESVPKSPKNYFKFFKKYN